MLLWSVQNTGLGGGGSGELPENTTPETALDLGDVPSSLTLITGGVSELYFTLTLPDAGQFGLRISSNTEGHDFAMYSDVGLTTEYLTPASGAGYIAGQNQPFQIPILTPGQTVWINVTSLSAVASLTIETYELPSETIPDYAVVVPDDTHSFPAVVLDPDTGAVLNYIDTVPASEVGSSLPNGYSLTWARSTNSGTPTGDATAAVLVNRTTFVQEIAGLFTLESQPLIRGNAATNTFWVAQADVAGEAFLVKQVNLFGTVVQSLGPFTLSPAQGNIKGFGISPDETIAYLSTIGSNPIKRLNLATGAFLSDLAPAIANTSIIQDVLVSPDGSVFVPYRTQAPLDLVSIVKHYSAAGATLHTYTIVTGSFPDIQHLAEAHDDGASFWVWLIDQDADGNAIGRFQRIQVSDGTVLKNLTSHEFNIGKGPSNGAAVTTEQSGHSNSCPFWVLINPDEAEPPVEPEPEPGQECVLEQPSASCWGSHNIDDLQVRLN